MKGRDHLSPEEKEAMSRGRKEKQDAMYSGRSLTNELEVPKFDDFEQFKRWKRNLSPEDRKKFSDQQRAKLDKKYPAPKKSKAPGIGLDILKKNREAIKDIYNKYKPMGYKGSGATKRDLEKLLAPQISKAAEGDKEFEKHIEDMVKFGLGQMELNTLQSAVLNKLKL